MDGVDFSGDFDLEIDLLDALLSDDDCVESLGLFRLKQKHIFSVYDPGCLQVTSSDLSELHQQ